MITYLIPCLGQLAVAAGSDVRWKPLNHQILMHTRNENPLIRLVALKVLNELYERLGEEMLVLFPETIPFLAELMEGEFFLSHFAFIEFLGCGELFADLF